MSGNQAASGHVESGMHLRHLPVVVLGLIALAACGDAEPAAQPMPPVDTTIPPGPTDPTLPPATTTPPQTLRYDPDQVRADLDAARERWAAENWTSYRYTYAPSCFCDQAELTVEVIDGRLVDQDDVDRARTVEGWFDEIDAAIGTAVDVRVTYDDSGAPSSLYVDVDETMADEEFGYELVDIEPVADGLDAFLDGEYGCGYGFALANAGQTVSMAVSFVGVDWETGPATGTYDLADVDGAVRFGTDLMANWCDDVIEVGEPEPEVDETWNIVSGTLELSVTDNRLATGTFTDVVAVDADGIEHDFGDVVVANGMWGFFAG